MRTIALTCPKCGASLSRPHEEQTVRCGYCGTSVVVETDVEAPRGGAGGPRDGRQAALVLAAVGAALVLGTLSMLVLTRRSARSPDPTSPPEPESAMTQAAPAADVPSVAAAPEPPRAPPPPPATASAAPTAEPSALADVVLEFGENGTGPGQLQDARAIAVDTSGDIYVADYGSLRIQRFDASGKFLAALRIEAGQHGNAIPSIATTSDGHLWVSRMGDLVELSIPDGKVVKTVPSQEPRVAYTGIAVDPTNVVYAANEGATSWIGVGDHVFPPRSDALRKLDKNGRLLAAWKGFTLGGSGFGDRVAVDQQGNVYLVERLRCIDVVDMHGKLKTRIDAHGSDGIAVDEKGRIFLGTGGSVSVYDATGAKLGQIIGDVDNLAMGRDGRLYTVSRSRVRVLALHP
jgi:sugar lactone lactonase YvrE/DNA-directed RNA polymerase subunit RPC12/RpoP